MKDLAANESKAKNHSRRLNINSNACIDLEKYELTYSDSFRERNQSIRILFEIIRKLYMKQTTKNVQLYTYMTTTSTKFLTKL